MFRRVGILGTGLIGGSLGCSLKKYRLAQEIIGVSRTPSSIARARRAGAIDRGSTELKVLKDVELLILAMPVEAIINRAPEVASVISPRCIVIDVGSSKTAIVSSLSRVFKRFVGTHPLAGSEKSGAGFASAGLLAGALCLLTPRSGTDAAALATVERMYRRIGCRTLRLSPQEHDRMLALTSHLPHLIAFALVRCLPGRYRGLVPNSFRDLTRVAASSAQLWEEIFRTNRKDVLFWLRLFEYQLALARTALQAGDNIRLAKLLRESSRKAATLRKPRT